MDISELTRIGSGSTVNRHPWELVRSRIILSFFQKNEHFNSIIDFGGGDSYLLRQLELNNKADNYFAIDNAYTNDVLLLLKQNADNTTIQYKTSLNEIDDKYIPAECMLFLDVLEHCEKDFDVLHLATSEKFVAKNGRIMITVPAYNFLFSDHDKLLNHYRRYNLKQLKFLCKQSGLVIEKSGYFFLMPLLMRCIQLVLEKLKIKKKAKSLDDWQHGKIFTRFVYGLLWADFSFGRFMNLIGIKLPGLSCYCCCRKQ
ncbi:MAG: hypothetical protein QM764_12415 [Chitinophagaceae bacterium]